ncbi:MAG: glutamate 5-kinase [bacterium]
MTEIINQNNDFFNLKKRIVVKIGTQVLINNEGKLSPASFKKITEFINALKLKRKEIIVVSSGAIAAGRNVLNIETSAKFLTIPQKQALASCGQSLLMKTYSSYFKKYNIKTAQILLTKDDISSRKRFTNARNTIYELLKNDVVPIINENDTIATEEIKFSDNDYLSALTANLACADLLIILSNVNGVYDKNPSLDKFANQIKIIDDIKHFISDFKDTSKSIHGTGGMKSKLESAYIASEAGIDTIIASGKDKKVLEDISNGKITGTFILSSGEDINKKKHWLIFGMEKNGSLICDKGAEEAILLNDKSLLASGIIDVKGNFKKHEGVYIANEQNKIIAAGISNFDAEEIKKIKGLKSSEIQLILNSINANGIGIAVHKNNMVLL